MTGAFGAQSGPANEQAPLWACSYSWSPAGFEIPKGSVSQRLASLLARNRGEPDRQSEQVPPLWSTDVRENLLLADKVYT